MTETKTRKPRAKETAPRARGGGRKSNAEKGEVTRSVRIWSHITPELEEFLQTQAGSHRGAYSDYLYFMLQALERSPALAEQVKQAMIEQQFV